MRRPKRVLQLFFGFLVILLFSTLVAQSASAATPVSDPGANIDHAALRHAAYNIKISNGRITITPNGAPLAYPTGCGLTVSAFREANFIDGDAFTGCNSTVASIQQDVTIYRSRWYGWQQMASNSNTDFNTSSSFVSVSYDCGGTGIHDFRVVGNGQVIPYGGSVATASAYDEIDNQNCG